MQIYISMFWGFPNYLAQYVDWTDALYYVLEKYTYVNVLEFLRKQFNILAT